MQYPDSKCINCKSFTAAAECLHLPMKSFPFIYCHTFHNFANSFKK